MGNSISQSKATAINLITGILTMVAQTAISFFLSPYIVQTLGEEANGFTQLANNFVTYATLITVAFNSMASRFISVSYHKGEHKKVKQYFSSVLVCNLIIFAIFIPLSIFIVANLENIIVIENADLQDVKMLFAFVFANYFVSAIITFSSIFVFVKNKLYIQNAINFIITFLKAIVLLIVFYVLPPKMYYTTLVALLLMIISVPVYIKIQKKTFPELKFSLKYFQFASVLELIKSGIWNTINQCGHILMTGLDLLLSNLFISPAAMGLLAVAKTIPSAVINLANVLNASFAPALTINWAHGEQKTILSQLRKSMKVSSVIISIPIITFCAFAVPFYSLWQPTLDAQKLAILSFLTMMAFIPFAGPQALYNVFTATNHLQINSITFVATGFLNAVIVYFLLKFTNLGVFAVAGVSSALSILRNMVVTVPYTAHLLKLKWYTFYKDVGVSILCCLVNYIVSLIVKSIVHIQAWHTLIISVLITCVLTLVVDLIIILNKEEREYVLGKIRRR